MPQHEKKRSLFLHVSTSPGGKALRMMLGNRGEMSGSLREIHACVEHFCLCGNTYISEYPGRYAQNTYYIYIYIIGTCIINQMATIHEAAGVDVDSPSC